MIDPAVHQAFDPRVGGIALPSATYDGEAGGRLVSAAFARVAASLGWATAERGPLANIVPRGAKVLLKPNFVLHENQGPWGVEPLVTHGSLVRAATEAALQAGASQVIVGDAPVQGCDFAELLRATELDTWATSLAESEPRFKGIRDFRRTTCVVVNGVRMSNEGLLPEDQFVLFDLGGDSLLEPITDSRDSFRVTCYDPRLLAQTHSPGRHQYLVARDILEADVIVNLPKLKTHKKAGITCALKNLIGINGNKEYLPHHRVGGSTTGGDCYPGASLVKRALERVADRQNMAQSIVTGKVWQGVARQLDRVTRLQGDRLGIEGSWSGNDTIWRTCLDLNRILLYGRSDRTMAAGIQRRVIHVVDAVVAGQGDGPLAPQPLPLGLIFAGHNAAAVDWVGARILGFDPDRVPVVRHAFDAFKWPLTASCPEATALAGDWAPDVAGRILSRRGGPLLPTVYPAGWVDAAVRDTAA
jgi:uncharacterized protein (DUF362 family)